MALVAGMGGRIAWGQSVQNPPLPADRALTQMVRTAWTTGEGLPQNSVNAIAQTTDGFIWLGTQEGLVRFDGVAFDVYDASISEAFRSNNIRTLLADRRGGLWVGTHDGGLIRYADNRFTHINSPGDERVMALLQREAGDVLVATGNRVFTLSDTTVTRVDVLQEGRISALAEDTRTGEVWIGTGKSGLYRLLDGVVSKAFAAHPVASAGINALAFSPDGTLWAGARDGIYRIDGERIEHLTRNDGLPSDAIVTLLPDAYGNLWAGTADSGIFRMATSPTLPVPARDQLARSPYGLTDTSVKALFIDREGSLWIGIDGGGVQQLRAGKVTPFTIEQGLADDHVYPIHEDPAGAIWFGGELGVTRMEPDGSTTLYNQASGLPTNFVLSIASTPDGAVWLGTMNGLARVLNGRIRTYTETDGLPDNAIYGLYADRAGALWIATGGGLSHFDGRTFTNYSEANGLVSNYVTVVLEDRHGTVWIGTYDKGLNLMKDGTLYTLKKSDGLSHDGILSLHEDDAGVLWVGTYGGGLNRIENGVISFVTSRDGLFNDKVSQILEDENRNLWISSNKGLYTVSRDEIARFAAGEITRITSHLYDRSDGLLSQEFTGGIQPAGWKSRDGRFWFPSDAGAVMVNPGAMVTNAIPPPVVIKKTEMNRPMTYVDGVYTLPAGTSRFEIQFTALTYVAPQKTRYRYILEGEDEDWIDAGTLRDAHYRNLEPGHYRFRVRAQNADGLWSDNEAIFSFELEPFFYQTSIFYIVISGLLAMLILAGHFLSVARMKARERELESLVEERTHDLKLEKEKTEEAKAVIEAHADKLRELDRFKTRFFANVSHEFRTPLTMIIGPLENALNGTYGALNATMGRQVDIMRRNALRLMRLINQLLDLSKLEAGKMQLRARPQNVVRFLEDVILTVAPFAEKKDIRLTFAAEQPELEVYFESEKFEKVFYNLLSNASKFTPARGAIDMTVREQTLAGGTPGVEVRVRDTGRGIPADQLPFIFDRFHQVDGSNTREHEGTGIGLALVKEMIELHGGGIAVESEVGAGTVFIITLRQGATHLQPEEVVATVEGDFEPRADLAFDGERPAGDSAATAVPTRRAEASPNAPTVLIVDDNADLRDYLESILGEHYHIAQAGDGLEGLAKAREIRPDLIVSDVMMPLMDGHALCRVIKSDPELNHTPLILLTARATNEMMLEGLEEGADDYMAKPFNARELLARVHNLLFMREQQRELSRSNEALRESNEHLIHANDTLIQRTVELIHSLEKNNEILGVASHDLKNPLAGIIGLAEIILENIRDSTDDDIKAEALECITLLHSEAARMLRIIKELLDKHREGEQLTLHKESIDLNDIIETALRWNHLQAIQKQIGIHYQRDRRVPVEVDVDAIMRVIDNLVSNAVKYSPPGSQVWIGLEHDRGSAVLRVRDEGPGLTSDDLGRVFGKGQQLSAKPTAGEHSTGLGLYIVKQLVEQHQGEVGVDSVAGHGATFWVRLPVLQFDPITALS